MLGMRKMRKKKLTASDMRTIRVVAACFKKAAREVAFRREGAAVQQPPVTVIGDLVHRKVAVFPNDSCPKVGEVMDMSPDGRSLLLKVSSETQPGSGYREGDVVYFAGSFVLKVIG